MMLLLRDTVITFFKRCAMVVAILIIIVAVISSVFRALTPLARQYKTQLEHHLSALLGQTVIIQSMETGWYWFEPVIKLKHLVVATHDKVRVKELLVGINLFSSLWHWQIQPGVLYVDALNVTLRKRHNTWQIDGLTTKNSVIPQVNVDSYSPILAWILAQQKMILKNIEVKIYLQDGTYIPLHDFNLHIANRSDHYYVKGSALLVTHPETRVSLLADMQLDTDALTQASGHAFLALKHVQLAQWQHFFPLSYITDVSGQGDAQVWFTWREGKMKTVQSYSAIHALKWHDMTTGKNHMMQEGSANVAWLATPIGWQLSADHFTLHLNDKVWPNNKLLLRYQRDNDRFYLYIKHLLLESLLAAAPALPSSLPIAPHGHISDMQMIVHDKKIHWLLARFNQVGWPPEKTRIGLDNISGVFYWQPLQGHLELDGENVVLRTAFSKAAPVFLQALQGVYEWKKLDRGWHVSMPHFLINHPDLLISAHGEIDGITEASSGQLNLDAQVSAHHAEQWFTYLPSPFIKPKLATWLKKDIHLIDSLTAQVTVNGLLQDFPFDKQPGVFAIKGHIQGVELMFNPTWPLTKALEAYMEVNKRALNIDLVQADLQGIAVSNANVRIEDIGLDHETLLVHSQFKQADAEKMLAYVWKSPLRKKLALLNRLQLQGELALDLQVEVPLYPENNKLLAEGDIGFTNNQAVFNYQWGTVPLHAINGTLQFNQSGITDSRLETTVLDYPITMQIQSFSTANPYTQVVMKGKAAIDALRRQLKWPLFLLMAGETEIEGRLTLTNDVHDLDHLHMQSWLKGVAIDLPPPFGKAQEKNASLLMDIDFNPDKALQIYMNYNQYIQGKVWFSGAAGQFRLQKGHIRFGTAPVTWDQENDIQIRGILSLFDWQAWRTTWSKLASLSAPTGQGVDFLRVIDVTIKRAMVFNQRYDELVIKAKKLKADDWSLQLNNSNVVAALRYHPDAKRLEGEVNHLYLQRVPSSKPFFTPINIENVPALDVHIHDLRFNDLLLGETAIKANRLQHVWQLDSCQIKSPFYTVAMQGEWKKEKGINSTTIQLNAHVQDLSKSLARLKIHPAVEAAQGDIQFQGGWADALSRFSLAKLFGQAVIVFKRGRITDLSPETEEKLGLGKLLSILSLQTIPRRLTLDFSDLANKGYSFDIFKGHFAIANGRMRTDDSYIDGPIAYVSMQGYLDIARQLYDLDLHVSPHITASLPVVATIAGGPVAGVATWIASKVINQSMQKISGYSYKISGPWKQPVVQEVNIIKKR